MKIGKGKQKGSNFEREICKELSFWLSDGEYKNVFRRNTFTKTGDLIVNPSLEDSEVRSLALKFLDLFNVECKCYKHIDLLSELDIGEQKRTKTDLEDWWEQCCSDAIKTKKQPLLIIKRNGHKPYVVADWAALLVCGKYSDVSACKMNSFIFYLKGRKVFLAKLNQFLYIDPKIFDLIINE